MIANYANIQNKSKEDAAMVEKRKRMLQKFLNRLAKHEILSYEHVFHRFLETGVSWVCFALFAVHQPVRARSVPFTGFAYHGDVTRLSFTLTPFDYWCFLPNN